MMSWAVKSPLFVRKIRKVVMSLVMSWVLFLGVDDDIPLVGLGQVWDP